MLQAIIFDMDGVIVDTEFLEYNLQAKFIESIKEHDRTLTQSERSEVVGKGLSEIPEIVKKLSNSSLPLEEIKRRYFDFFNQLFSTVNYLSIFRSDIQKIIDFAKQHHIKLAVASSSRLEHIQNILTKCDIIQHFDFIVSGEQFERSKPDPTIYRYTLEKLGVQAKNTVAIEVSFFGIQAAKSAGIPVIAYEEKRILIDQSEADYCGKDMSEILTIIQKLHY
ncbi:HAD family hydrolase [Rodentibacter caecimuris]|uniref:HAD family hydrolase n=1 Tax=Rodentibacter caecimuris TaxID=1796644 RepID=UPI0007515E23|nr:HAD family phosphatase [Rodentibacter heylii]AOF52383.1 Phosphoglycolate phosphatase [Pasteurellaceae bacterium NI1060]MCQ9123105.1 HAD family phosphatase [Rodentibacter heylii]MCX2962315.1 HAD family phosphatase [Rodentibacter heylii]OOF73686.1 phosphatase [Rodentibacter heylii]QIA76491.1 HAD family phosphatase [Rodentibacter heylii]